METILSEDENGILVCSREELRWIYKCLWDQYRTWHPEAFNHADMMNKIKALIEAMDA